MKALTFSEQKLATSAGKQWLLISWKTKNLDGTIINSYQDLSNCAKDDPYIFYANKKFIRLDGSMACDTTAISFSAANWALENNDTELKFSGFGSQAVFNVKNLTDTSLVLNLQLLIYQGDTATSTYTFKAI